MTPLRCVTLIAAILLWNLLAALLIERVSPAGVPQEVFRIVNSLRSATVSVSEAEALTNVALACAAVLAIAVTYITWRIECYRNKIAAPPRWFLYCAAWSCALGTLVLPPAIWLLCDALPDAPAAWGLYLLYAPFAPAALAPLLLRARSRWRPVCPECGYSLSRTRAARCSECGEPFPTDRRRYRRWAIQRLPWDRRHRSPLSAYASSFVRIIFTPWLAALRLANPDGVARAVRWIAGHAALMFLVVPLLPLIRDVAVPAFAPPLRSAQIEEAAVLADAQPDALRMRWHMQWIAAWLVAGVAFPIALGCWLVFAFPGISPAARVAIIKWTLYAGLPPLLMTMIVVVVPGFIVNTGILARERSSVTTWIASLHILTDRNPTMFVNRAWLLFACYWAIGVASNPWLRHRGPIVFGVALVAFLACWRLAVRVVPISPFEVLL